MPFLNEKQRRYVWMKRRAGEIGMPPSYLSIPAIRNGVYRLLDEHQLPRDQYVIGGSTALYLHGLRSENPSDINFYAPGLPGNTNRVYEGTHVNAFPDLMGLEEHAMKNRVRMNGLWVEHPETSLLVRQKLNRPKDQADIEMLKQHLTAQEKGPELSEASKVAFLDELGKIAAEVSHGYNDPSGRWSGPSAAY